MTGSDTTTTASSTIGMTPAPAAESSNLLSPAVAVATIASCARERNEEMPRQPNLPHLSHLHP